MRCRETAGLLFPRACHEAAAVQCAKCARPVCAAHVRPAGGTQLCVSCVREGIRDQQHRGSFAHLANDPYFFWYFTSPHTGDFTGSDYALFGDAGGDFDEGFERDWSGS
jgi:hypothetical protein